MLKQLLTSAALTSATKVAGLLAGLLSVAITSRLLGPEGRGYIAVVTTMVGLAATFGHLSLGQVALKHAAEAGEDHWVPNALGVLLVMTVVMSIIYGGSLAVATLTGWAHEVTELPLTYLLIGYLALPLTIWTTYSAYLLLATDRIRQSNVAHLSGTVASLLGVVVLVLLLRLGVTGALLATVIGLLVNTGVGARGLIAASGRRVGISRAVARRFLVDGAKLHLTAIGAYIFSGLDILMVHHYRGPVDAGLFQLAFQLYAPLLLIPQAVMEVLSTKLAALGARGVWPHQRRLMLLAVGVMVLLGGALALAAPVIVRLLAGPEFDASVPIFRIYLLSLVAAAVNGIMGVQWIGRGLFLQTSALTFAAGVANFLFNLAFIPRYGASGAAVATVVGVYAIPFTANVLLAIHCERDARQHSGTLAPIIEGT